MADLPGLVGCGDVVGVGMIDWVHECCREWGHQQRKMLNDSGFPPKSLLGRLVEEGPGAGSASQFMQHFPEVLEGDALIVGNAVKRMVEKHNLPGPCQVVIAHYMFAGKAAGKAKAMHVDMPTYWRHLHTAHCFIAGHFDVPRETKVLQHQVA